MTGARSYEEEKWQTTERGVGATDAHLRSVVRNLVEL